MPHLTPLHAACADAVATRAGVDAAQLKVDIPPKPELGDFAVGCFAIAKAKGANPADIAREIAGAFTPTELLASATATGPFVNFRANRAAVFEWLIGAAAQRTLVPRDIGKGQTIVIDYSSPNVSKQLAYHHIRSTMIGHALVQIFRALGYTVVGLNHLGDWGTTHGNLIAAWKKWGPIEPVTIEVLNDLYVKFGDAVKAGDTTLKAEGRAWFKRLEDGDADALALWKRFYAVSMAEYQTVYDTLGVKFDIVKGESEYLGDVPRVLKELADKGLSQMSENALVVPFDDIKAPLILIKDDGATTYATRDIPSAEWRWTEYHFARSLYVVDRGQSLHFKQLFKTLALMGREWASRCEHIPFGLVQIGGKKGSTRSGNVVLLKEVVGEAEQRVRALLAEQQARSDEQRADKGLASEELRSKELIDQVAPVIGIGAVLFANLASQRDKDVAFEWDRVIALQGDSGVYVQYSHARCASILRKAAGLPLGTLDFARLEHDAEWAVARRLLEFPAAVFAATPSCEPHIVCHYLLALAAEFSAWYTAGNENAALRVLCEDAPTRMARLALVSAVQAVLRQGLDLLGIAAPDQM
jgi:arginyl-tRNA synthetase